MQACRQALDVGSLVGTRRSFCNLLAGVACRTLCRVKSGCRISLGLSTLRCILQLGLPDCLTVSAAGLPALAGLQLLTRFDVGRPGANA